MVKTSAVILALATGTLGQRQFQPRPGYFPETGNDSIAGGIFSISLTDLARTLMRLPGGGTSNGSEAPRTTGTSGTTGGSGPYKARMTTDPSLPDHTIYAPQNAPAGQALPFVAWGNGACGMDGAGYKELLLEIASHGYIISSDGAPSNMGSSGGSSSSGLLGRLRGGSSGGGSGLGLGSFGGRQSTWTDMKNSIDWALKGGSGGKYGKIDTTKIATAGHSCGGLSAMSNAYHNPNVKLIMLFNIAIFQDEKRYLLQEIKVPVAYLIGGTKDMAYNNAEKDYKLLTKVPAYKANLDSGHMGTFKAPNGGKFGKAAVAYLQWQFRGNATAKAVATGKGAGSLVADNWKVEFKGFKN